jgi:hypothetical protein
MSTGCDGEPTAVSGIIVVPHRPAPADGRKVVAWTHGTVGVAPNCSPSLISGHGRLVPGIGEFEGRLRHRRHRLPGSRYTRPSPYLVGDSEGVGALDNVRAARNFAEADASGDFVVWGESQGGHASLFAGQLASTYAPELNLQGVIASAPRRPRGSLQDEDEQTQRGRQHPHLACESPFRGAHRILALHTASARALWAFVGRTIGGMTECVRAGRTEGLDVRRVLAA